MKNEINIGKNIWTLKEIFEAGEKGICILNKNMLDYLCECEETVLYHMIREISGMKVQDSDLNEEMISLGINAKNQRVLHRVDEDGLSVYIDEK